MKQINSEVLKKDITKSVNLFLHPLKFLCLFLVLAFSVDGFACEGVTGTVDGPSNPNDPASNYSAGRIMYCTGKKKGLDYIERASDMDHVTASYFLGDYYRKTFNSSTRQEDYDAAIFYYDRAATLIENTSHYPNGAHHGVSEVEGKQYMSVRAFLHLTVLYLNGYSRALGDMLRNDVSYTDTIQVLENMKSAAERCLKRSSLSVWGARQKEIANSKQVICQARKDFAEKALGTEQVPGLEFRRIEIASHCDVALGECTEHQVIFQELVQAVQEMNNEVDSVPKI